MHVLIKLSVSDSCGVLGHCHWKMIGKLFALGILISSTAGLQCYLSTSPISRLLSVNIDGSPTRGFVGGSDTNQDVINNIKYTFNKGELQPTLIDCEKEAPGATLCVKQQSSVEGVRHALRACWTDEGESTGCTEFEVGLGENVSRCFCNTDGCNGGIRCITSIWVVFALFLFLIFY